MKIANLTPFGLRLSRIAEGDATPLRKRRGENKISHHSLSGSGA